MLRKFAVLAALVAVATGTYVATSWATTSGAGLPPDVTAATALPPVALSTAQQVAIQNTIGADAASQYGITSSSYSQVRQIGVTSVGTLYVVPGTAGQCVVLADAMSCGNAGGGNDQAVAVFHSDANGDYVGGGVLTSSVKHVTLTDYTGATANATVTSGGFMLTAPGIKAGPTLQVSYR